MQFPLVSRLKKKSQSIDISASGYDPLAPAPHQTLQPAKPTAIVTNTTTSEEEQKNTANTQRRNPRRGELKRYYTIGKLKKNPYFILKQLICCIEGKLFPWNNQSDNYFIGWIRDAGI